jgi:hypothetical protein
VRSRITDLIELLALCLIVTGIALIWIPAAFIAAGLGLVLVSTSIERRGRL